MDKYSFFYKVPDNWCWTKLGKITSIIGGGTPSSKINEYYDNGDIAWITPSDLSNYNNMYISKGKKMITKLGLMKSSAKLLPKGTVCLSSRAPIGYVVIAKNELSTNQGFKSFLPSKVFKSEYLYWYLKSIKHILEAKASGTTFLELSAKKAGEVEIPLPPINEQQRIVNRIESLFVKLNRAKELIENTLAQFEQNKMAILHKAFTGELTVKWRQKYDYHIKENSFETVQELYNLPNNWQWVKMKDISSIVAGGTPSTKREEYYNNGNIPWITPADLSDYEDMYIFRGKRMITKLGLEKSSARLMPKGTVCLSSRAPIGYVVIAENEISTNQGFKNFLPSKFFIPEYLYWYLKSAKYILEAKASGTTFLELSAKKAGEIEFPLAPIEEQREIVKILDKIFTKYDKTKILRDQLDKIELLKKSILAKAFRGELGTNDPNEESAEVLLREILAEK